MKSHRFLALLLSFVPAWAAAPAAPVFTNIAPRGAERGKSVEVVVTGTNLTTDTRLWVPFTAKVERLPDEKPTPTQARFRITVDDKTPIGFFPLRLFGSEGVSAVQFFAIDPFVGGVEKEDNNSLDKAQLVTLPVVLDGQCAGGDVDCFRLAAKKGQRVVIETEAARLGSALVPLLRLTDDRGRFVASDDSQRLLGDARLHFVAPADGAFVVELCDTRFRGGAPAHYRLKIGDYDAADEVFPAGYERDKAATFLWRGGNLDKDLHWEQVLENLPGQRGPEFHRLRPPAGWKEGTAWPEVLVGPHRHVPFFKAGGLKPDEVAAAPFTVAGAFEKPGEVHLLEMSVKEGEKLRLNVQAESLGSRLDGLLRLSDDKGKVLAQADDADVPPAVAGQPATKTADPSLEFVAPKGLGKLRIELRDAHDRGGVNFGYLLTVEPAVPDFLLRLPAAEFNVRRGAAGAVAVTIVRRGYDGPIQLAPRDLPSGWKFEGGYVPAKFNVGLFTLEADAAKPLDGPVFLGISGTALEGPKLTRDADSRLVLSKDGNVAASTIRFDRLALGLDVAPPFVLKSGAAIELVHGYVKQLPVGVLWKPDAKAPLPPVELSAVLAGDGGKPVAGAVAVKPANVAAGDKEGLVLLTAPTTIAEGRTLDLVPLAKTKFAGQDLLVAGGAVRVTVHRPFVWEAARELSMRPGESSMVTLNLKRRPEFKEIINVKVEGLPAGVSLVAAPKPIAADQNQLRFELKADAKAAPATGALTVSAAATINGMAYSHPPLPLKIEIKK